jgi:hypothetical protein
VKTRRYRAGFRASLLFAGAFPRTTFTGLQLVSGKVTSWTLPALFLIICLTISVVTAALFDEASATELNMPIRSGTTIAIPLFRIWLRIDPRSVPVTPRPAWREAALHRILT